MLSAVFYGATSMAIVSFVLTMAMLYLATGLMLVTCGFLYGMRLLANQTI